MSEIGGEIWIATYGTLKNGYNNYKLHLTNSTLIGSGTTQDKYPLIIKDMPYLIEEVGVGYQIEVDVFTIGQQVLYRLDELEEHPNWYRRKEIPINLNGKTYSCWVYFSMTESIGDSTLHNSYIQEPGKLYPYTRCSAIPEEEMLQNQQGNEQGLG
jgi:gamma-glutamylaminecyclotransferase